MTTNHGKFCWYELGTTDMEGARAFYGEVVGLTARTVPMPGMDYAMWIKPGSDEAMGGLAPLAEEARAMGVPSNWTVYVAVRGVADAVAKAKALGAQVHLPPTPIPGFGEFAILADPHGATFAVYTGTEEKALTGVETALGGVGWHELMTSDLEAGFAFYAALFGWEKIDDLDMGPMGVYRMFGKGADAWGGMMVRPADMPVSAWLPYINVPDADAVAERTKAMGGVVMMTTDVPGGGRITMGADPQGAAFAVVAAAKA